MGKIKKKSDNKIVYLSPRNMQYTNETISARYRLFPCFVGNTWNRFEHIYQYKRLGYVILIFNCLLNFNPYLKFCIPRFRDGRTVESSISEVTNGITVLEDIPLIEASFLFFKWFRTFYIACWFGECKDDDCQYVHSQLIAIANKTITHSCLNKYFLS